MPDVIIRIVLTLKMAKDIVAYASQDNRETPIQDVTVCLYVYFLNSCSTEGQITRGFLKSFHCSYVGDRHR